MRSSIRYSGIFTLGDFVHPSGPNEARLRVMHFGKEESRKRANIFFYPGVGHVDGVNRNNPLVSLKKAVKYVIRRCFSIISHLASRLTGLSDFRQDLNADPVRVRPLKTKAKTAQSTEEAPNNWYAKTGKSDADALLEMKRNPQTSVYEVKRIIAAVG